MLTTPIFVHCFECRLRVSPSGRMLFSGGAAYSVTPEALAALCMGVRGGVYGR